MERMIEGLKLAITKKEGEAATVMAEKHRLQRRRLSISSRKWVMIG